MKVAYAFVIICSCAAWQGFAQTSIDLRTQAKSVDFSAATSTKPAKVSTALPATCTVGEAVFRSDAPAGKNWYLCTATNVWSLSSGTDYAAGPGIQIAGASVATDDAVVPLYHTGSGAPVFPCTAGRDFYTDTTNRVQYQCTAADTWTPLSAAGHTHSGGDISSGAVALARGGTNQGNWIAGRCVQVAADGSRLESAAGACGSGGGAGKVFFGGNGLSDTVGASATEYFGLGTAGGSMSQQNRDWITPMAGNLKNFYVRIFNTQPSDGSLTCTVRVNSVDTVLSASFTNADGGPRTKSDLVNTVAVNAGDSIVLRCVNSSASASAQLTAWALQLE